MAAFEAIILSNNPMTAIIEVEVITRAMLWPSGEFGSWWYKLVCERPKNLKIPLAMQPVH